MGCLDDDERNEKIAEEWAKNKEKFGKTIVFCVSVEHCHNLMTKFRKHSSNISTAVVTGKTDKFNRDTIVKAFDEGDIDVLFNCQVFTEGFDSPTIQTVIVARPTMSESLFMQMIGRGSRITKTKKEYNLVVVVDDVQRFASVVKQWKPLLIGKTKEDLAQERIDKELKEAFEKVSSTLADNQIDIKLGDISPVDVEAVLTVSGRYKQNQSFIIDRDKDDCIRRLFYMKHTASKSEVSERNRYVNSYTFCVPQGEFNHKEWETIVYAWFDYYISENNTISVDDGNQYKVWDKIVLRDSLNIKQKEVIKIRIERSFKIATNKNNLFNKIYSTLDSKNKLLKELHDTYKSTGKKSKHMKIVLPNIVSVECFDRQVIVQTSLERNDSFNMYAVGYANRIYTEILSELIQDPCCRVRFKLGSYY